VPYFESKLRIYLDNFSEIKRKLDFCDKLDIKNIILEPIDYFRKIPIQFKNKVENYTNSNIYYRINLKAINLKKFKKQISKFSNISDIISIETKNPKIQLFAARDSRVDLISYVNFEILKTLRSGVLSLARQNHTFIEFTLNHIMSENVRFQSKISRMLYKSINMAKEAKVKYIISGNFIDIYNYRNPRALISILNTLIGIPMQNAKDAFSKNVISLIKRAQKRVNPHIIEKGVKLIEESEK